MGQHYVQQSYLRCFGTPEDPDKIWMYNKSSKEFKRLPIKNVAQSSGFYSEEDERALSEKIEGPAQGPLEQLRNGQRLQVQGRLAVTVYLESMIKRVPHTRKKMLGMAPKEKTKLLAELRENPELLAPRFNLTSAELLRVMEQWEQKFDSKPLSIKDDIIRRQWFSLDVINCIFSMTWRVVQADESNRFLTSDNPVFFGQGYGLKKSYGEFSFPLSSDVSLHGSWQGSRGGLIFVQATPAQVKEINRRVVFGAERLVFYHKKACWVSVVAEKRQPRLNRIEWQLGWSS